MSTFVIELHDGLPLTYWSDLPTIHPAGNWGDKKDAKNFAQASDARAYINSNLASQAELCRVVPR